MRTAPSDSPPILCLPGWGLGRGPLAALVSLLGAQWYDLPGYGRTGSSDTFGQAIQRLSNEAPRGTCLLGWSLGTMLALAAARLAPDVFSAVVAISPTPSFIRRPGWSLGLAPAQLAVFREQVRTDAPAALRRFIVEFNRGDLLAKEISRRLMREADTLPSTRVLTTGLDWLEETDLRAALPGLEVPILVFHGTADGLIPPAAGRWVAEHVAHGRFVAVEGAAHAPFCGREDFFVKEIRRFLQQMVPDGTGI